MSYREAPPPEAIHSAPPGWVPGAGPPPPPPTSASADNSVSMSNEPPPFGGIKPELPPPRRAGAPGAPSRRGHGRAAPGMPFNPLGDAMMHSLKRHLGGPGGGGGAGKLPSSAPPPPVVRSSAGSSNSSPSGTPEQKPRRAMGGAGAGRGAWRARSGRAARTRAGAPGLPPRSSPSAAPPSPAVAFPNHNTPSSNSTSGTNNAAVDQSGVFKPRRPAPQLGAGGAPPAMATDTAASAPASATAAAPPASPSPASSVSNAPPPPHVSPRAPLLQYGATPAAPQTTTAPAPQQPAEIYSPVHLLEEEPASEYAPARPGAAAANALPGPTTTAPAAAQNQLVSSMASPLSPRKKAPQRKVSFSEQVQLIDDQGSVSVVSPSPGRKLSSLGAPPSPNSMQQQGGMMNPLTMTASSASMHQRSLDPPPSASPQSIISPRSRQKLGKFFGISPDSGQPSPSNEPQSSTFGSSSSSASSSSSKKEKKEKKNAKSAADNFVISGPTLVSSSSTSTSGAPMAVSAGGASGGGSGGGGAVPSISAPVMDKAKSEAARAEFENLVQAHVGLVSSLSPRLRSGSTIAGSPREDGVPLSPPGSARPIPVSSSSNDHHVNSTPSALPPLHQQNRSPRSPRGGPPAISPRAVPSMAPSSSSPRGAAAAGTSPRRFTNGAGNNSHPPPLSGSIRDFISSRVPGFPARALDLLMPLLDENMADSLDDIKLWREPEFREIGFRPLVPLQKLVRALDDAYPELRRSGKESAAAAAAAAAASAAPTPSSNGAAPRLNSQRGPPSAMVSPRAVNSLSPRSSPRDGGATGPASRGIPAHEVSRVEQAWFFLPRCTRDEAVKRLSGQPAGMFLVRPSSGGSFALAFVREVDSEGASRVGHGLFTYTGTGWSLDGATGGQRDTVDDLVQSYSGLNYAESKAWLTSVERSPRQSKPVSKDYGEIPIPGGGPPPAGGASGGGGGAQAQQQRMLAAAVAARSPSGSPGLSHSASNSGRSSNESDSSPRFRRQRAQTAAGAESLSSSSRLASATERPVPPSPLGSAAGRGGFFYGQRPRGPPLSTANGISQYGPVSATVAERNSGENDRLKNLEDHRRLRRSVSSPVMPNAEVFRPPPRENDTQDQQYQPYNIDEQEPVKMVGSHSGRM